MNFYDIMTKFVPTTKQQYIGYDGSLTTPPCTEMINWKVLTTPLKITETQLNVLKKQFGTDGNARAIQPLNGRKMYLGNQESCPANEIYTLKDI